MDKLSSISEKKTKVLTRVTLNVNGWDPADYMSYTSQNFRLFRLSNLSVQNFCVYFLL